MRIDLVDLEIFTNLLLTKVGLDSYSVQAVGNSLVETSLRGVDSHGIRLLPHYVNSAMSGRKNKAPNFKFYNKYPSVFGLDADNAFGHSAGMKAVDKAMEAADVFGVGIVGVYNSSHPGAMASMALKASRKGYMAMAFTHADALTLTFDGIRPFFGTNPICFAVPRDNDEPYCLDMATSIAPWNKVKQAIANNVRLDDGIAADENGFSTNDPKSARAVFPTGGYKGVGLASMVEILCSVFTGMCFGRDIPPMFTTPIDLKRKLGQFYIVMKPDGIISQEQFLKSMADLTMQFRNEPPAPGKKIFMAGDKEIYESRIREEQGIPLDQSTYNELLRLSKEFNIELKTRNNT